ncbi:MAG TPA: ester cyclase [Azospirillaceae bacterium]|nr:ester cyclase [Azospirillaceae bacterium]
MADHQRNKRIVWDAFQTLDEASLRGLMHPDVAWHGPHPLNDMAGADAVMATLWGPLFRALPDLERRDDIFFAGEFNGGAWVTATGHYTGTFKAPWLGIPATNGVLNIRYGEFFRLEEGRVVEVYQILDIPDVMRQARLWPWAFSLGVEERVPAPATQDGLMLGLHDEAEGVKSRKLVEAMIAGLMEFDGKTLESMRMERFWHPKMMWYGPAGIGTARGLKGFQDCHQRAFLKAFPDRKGGNHKARLGEGNYVASTGWPSIRATHTGGGFMGCPPTNKPITMRVMDFWRREGDWLRENWVFIDLIELLLQMEVDIFARLREGGRLP